MSTYRPLVIVNGIVRQLSDSDTLYVASFSIGGFVLAAPTAADQVLVSTASNATAWQSLPDCWVITSTQISNWDTAYGWGDHDGLYDPVGTGAAEASAAVAAHELAYNHANYDTAYSWGDHAGLYDAIGSATTAVTTHESSYFHATGPTADNQILQATGVGTAAWTTDVQTLTSLTVDDLTLDGNDITSSTGIIQAHGSIDLDDTTSDSTGVISKEGTPFIHNFHHPDGGTVVPTGYNIFVGFAGNFTMGSTATIASHGSYNVGVGAYALYFNTTGYSNMAIGSRAMQNNLTGYACVAIGYEALKGVNSSGYYNVAIGLQSLFSTTSGVVNCAIGPLSLYSITNGTYNIGIGYQAGRFLANGTSANDTPDYCMYLGVNTKSGASNAQNEIVIGYNAIGSGSNTATIGNDSITSTSLKGDVLLEADNQKVLFGAGQDASFYYDGLDLYCNPKEVGSGKLIVLGEMEVQDDLVVNGINVTENIQVGGSDVCRVLSENKTYYVRTTGNDTTGDGTSGTPWATVGRALDDVYKWVADENTITIDVGEGTFTESTLSPTYAYGSNLVVAGVAETHTSGCAVSSIGSVTALETGLEYIDFTVTLPSGYTSAVGQYIACKTTSGGTNNHLVLGVHEVVGWNAGTRAATVRCVRRAGVTAVPSGAISLTDIRVIKTVLAFATGHGVSMTGAYHGGNWDALVLAGNSSGYALNLTNGASIAASSSFATSDWNNTIYCAGNGNFFGDSTCHSFCRGSLIRVQNGGVAQIRYGTVLTGAKTTGIFCFVGATVAAYQIQMATCGNADGVLCYQGGFVDVSSGYVRDGNPTGNGCNANRGGGIDATSATISGYATSTATATNGYIIGP